MATQQHACDRGRTDGEDRAPEPEFIHRTKWTTRDAVYSYIDTWYNSKMLHSTLGFSDQLILGHFALSTKSRTWLGTMTSLANDTSLTQVSFDRGSIRHVARDSLSGSFIGQNVDAKQCDLKMALFLAFKRKS